MLKPEHQKQICLEVLSHLPENFERKKLMPALAKAYVDMVWEEALTDEERNFYISTPQDVNCLDTLQIFPYYNSIDYYVFEDDIFNKEDLGIDSPERVFKYKQEGRVNMTSEYLSSFPREDRWEIFPTELLPIEELEKQYNFHLVPSLSNPPEKKLFFPDVIVNPLRAVEIGEERDENSKERIPLRCYRRIRGVSWYEYMCPEFRVEGPKTDHYLEVLKQYVIICRKIMHKIHKLFEFITLPDLSITFLRTNFPELIKDVKFSK